MTFRRILLLGALLSLLALCCAGCATSFAEWGDNMPNQRGRHVQPYDVDQPNSNVENEAIRPIRGLSVPFVAPELW
ncbi:MAG TPA: hypothetical protein VFZ08_09455 [Terriglobia bacterium]|nr:hypothetical protein [Terriglobia bacterium]